jgi:SWIM zinc finger
MRHLHENFHKKFKHPDLGILLWQAARATTEDVYLDTIKKMRDINEKAVDWLLKEAKPEFWVECYFEGNRYGHLTSNIAESFNSKILTAREQPILAMLETIRQQLMDWFTARRLLEAKTPGFLVSTVLNQLNELTKRARKYRRARESIPGVLFEITSNETGRQYLVNLDLHTCSCHAWQSTGYPCSHALSVILTRQLSVDDYTKSFFTLDAFRKTCSNVIIPPSISNLGAMTAGPLPPPEPADCADESSDEEVDSEEDDNGHEDDSEEESILPPTVHRQPGRLRKERTEAEKERRRLRRGTVRRIQKCRLCRAVGHSKRTCKGPLI